MNFARRRRASARYVSANGNMFRILNIRFYTFKMCRQRSASEPCAYTAELRAVALAARAHETTILCDSVSGRRTRRTRCPLPDYAQRRRRRRRLRRRVAVRNCACKSHREDADHDNDARFTARSCSHSNECV